MRVKISNAEWQVMKVIWAKGEVTSREIMDTIGTKFEWTPSTVKTLLSRLVEKKCVMTTKIGNKFYYSYVFSESESIRQIIREVNEKTCAVKLPSVIGDLILQSDFTMSDLDRLEEIICSKRQVVVERITCTCVVCDCVICECKK